MSDQAPDSASVRITDDAVSIPESHDLSHGESGASEHPEIALWRKNGGELKAVALRIFQRDILPKLLHEMPVHDLSYEDIKEHIVGAMPNNGKDMCRKPAFTAAAAQGCAMTPEDFRAWLRVVVEREGGQSALAKTWGVSRAHLSDIVNGRRTPGTRLLKRMGLTKTVVTKVAYRKANQ